MSQPDEEIYVLFDRRHTQGRSGRDLYRWRWINLATGREWETTTDSSFRNWRQNGWQSMSQDPNPWGVYSGLRPSSRSTKGGVGVITADSWPQRIESLTREQAQQAHELLSSPECNQFSQLFDAAT